MTNWKRLRRSCSLLAAAAAALAPACAADRADPSFDLVPSTILGTPVAVGDRAVPQSLRCVSSPIVDGAAVAQVLRVSIASGIAGAGTVTLERGPQFWSHGGVWAEGGATETRQVVSTPDGAVLEQEARFGLRIDLARDGAVVRGTLVDDQCYQRVEAQLTCWNDLELFGSPWAGVPGLLAAHFEWETGTCVDAEGAPALNRAPIEVVRETGAGECADLRGVSLNGGDLAWPDLDGWILLGARLDDARLSFASLRTASLQGADLSDLDFGYATVEGFIDAHTVLPGGGEGCEVTRSPWAGDSVSCSR
jgi:hypothetical protein